MSSRIAIVTDSSTCLPNETIQRLGIRAVPIPILIGDEVAADGSITIGELFERSDERGVVPRTATPSPGDFLAAFQWARDAGCGSVLCLTLAARFSGTYQAALAGADLFRGESPDTSVTVVDTQAIAAAHGFAVQAAATALRTGGCVDEAVANASKAVEDTVLIGAIADVRYMARSGRVPRLVGQAVAALGIRPVMSFGGGRERLVGRPRTAEAAMACIVDRAVARFDMAAEVEAVVLHAAAGANAESLAGRVQTRILVREIRVTECSAAMAAHTGPGFLALAVKPRA